MSIEILREQADRCRRLAAQADHITKARLLKLAEEYDDRIEALEQPGRSAASRKLTRSGQVRS